MIYNLIGRATVWFARQYIGRRVPRSTALIAVAAAVGLAGLIAIVGGTALTAGSKGDPDY